MSSTIAFLQFEYEDYNQLPIVSVTTNLFSYFEDFPFPLSMPYSLRVIFGIYLILIIIGGLTCRKMILQYLQAPDTKSNPINSLIWMDQLNGIVFGTFNLVYGAVVLVLPISLKSIFGQQFCDWIPLAGCINLTGYIIWSCLIAIYRILYIKAQKWVKYGIGERRLLVVCITVGLSLQLCLSLGIFYFDDESLVAKVCSHYSAEDLQILHLYKVKGSWNFFESQTGRLTQTYAIVPNKFWRITRPRFAT